MPRLRIAPIVKHHATTEPPHERIKRMAVAVEDLRSRLARFNRGAEPEEYGRLVRLLVDRQKGLNYILRKHGNGNKQ